MRPTMNMKIARAASFDAGNRSMRAAGRTEWNDDDLQAAHDEFARLMETVPA